MFGNRAPLVLLCSWLLGCSNGLVGGAAEICEQAAAHLAQCTGKQPGRAAGACDLARAQQILESPCDGRSSQSWFDDLCAFGFIDCSGLGNGGTGFTDPLAGGAAGGSCGTVTEQGSCNGDVLSYCDFGQVITYPCDPGTCALQAGGYYDCGSASGAPTQPTQPTQPGATGCGTVTEQGSCNGDVLSYCDLGQVITYPCDPGTCALQAGGYYDCGSASGAPTQPAQPGAGCGGVTEGGTCNGNVLSYCDNGQLVTYDCGTMTCQVASGWADCM